VKSESPPSAKALRGFSRSLPMLLLRGHQAVMAEFRPVLREHGITEQQWRVLRALTTADSLRISQLVAATLISAPSLTRILRSLEQNRLVARRVEAGDQRAARISITAAGVRLIATVAPESEARYARIAARYGKDELEALYRLLRKLPASLKRSP
jgi:homoprotocatechuate degradation regulator HpaR